MITVLNSSTIFGTNCDHQGSDFYHRTQLMPGLAAPSILAINDDFSIVKGTSNAIVLTIFRLTDMINFQLRFNYDPSVVDPT